MPEHPTHKGNHNQERVVSLDQGLRCLDVHLHTCGECRDALAKNGTSVSATEMSIIIVELFAHIAKDNHRKSFQEEVEQAINYLKASPQRLLRILWESAWEKFRRAIATVLAFAIVASKR